MVLLSGNLILPFKDPEPSLFDDTVGMASEVAGGAYGIHCGVFHFACGHEGFQHPPDNHQVKLHFLPFQCFGIHIGDDDGMVLRYPLLVDNPVRQIENIDSHCPDIRPEFFPVENLFHGGRQPVVNIPGKETAGSTRIGNQFLLVKPLYNFQ